MLTKTNLPIKVSIIILMIIIGIAISWVRFLYTPIVTDPKGLNYTVRPGSSINTVIDELHTLHVINNPEYFKLLVRMKKVAHQLKAGEYHFSQGTTSPKLLHQIITGTGMIYHPFMIIPGWNFRDLRKALLQDNYLHHTIENLSDSEIMTRIGHPELKPEGEFYPDTYYFVADVDDITLLKRAFEAMQKKFNPAWQNRELGLPFKTPYEALVAASIIEKEFYYKNELPEIAGVLINRLRSNMLLQFDPTVIYGMGTAYQGTIHKSDLLADNPYNTYVHKGLPPTPISMPSFASIQAVLHPMKHNFYYFVAQRTGAHEFTKNLSDHYKAVEQARKIKWFFNDTLARYYLIKVFSQRISTLS